MRPERIRLLSRAAVLAAALALMGVIYIRYVPKYPQAAYAVGSYEELSAALGDSSALLLPPEELLPQGNSAFLVRLVFCTSSAPSGYSIYHTRADGVQDFSLDCESLALLSSAEGPEVSPPEPIRPDTLYRTVPIQILEHEGLACAAFDWGGQRWSTSMRNGDALSFAQSLLDLLLGTP